MGEKPDNQNDQIPEFSATESDPRFNKEYDHPQDVPTYDDEVVVNGGHISHFLKDSDIDQILKEGIGLPIQIKRPGKVMEYYVINTAKYFDWSIKKIEETDIVQSDVYFGLLNRALSLEENIADVWIDAPKDFDGYPSLLEFILLSTEFKSTVIKRVLDIINLSIQQGGQKWSSDALWLGVVNAVDSEISPYLGEPNAEALTDIKVKIKVAVKFLETITKGSLYFARQQKAVRTIFVKFGEELDKRGVLYQLAYHHEDIEYKIVDLYDVLKDNDREIENRKHLYQVALALLTELRRVEKLLEDSGHQGKTETQEINLTIQKLLHGEEE